MPQNKTEITRQGQKASSGNLITKSNADTGLVVTVSGRGNSDQMRPQVNLARTASQEIAGVLLEDQGEKQGVLYATQGQFFVRTDIELSDSLIGKRVHAESGRSRAGRVTVGDSTYDSINSGDTINSLIYRGSGASTPGSTNSSEFFLVTSGGEVTEIQVSSGAASYAASNVLTVFGANGKFLGSIVGSEDGSSSVNSESTAEAYFTADPDRFDSNNDYYFYDGSDLRTIVFNEATQKGIMVIGYREVDNINYLLLEVNLP